MLRFLGGITLKYPYFAKKQKHLTRHDQRYYTNKDKWNYSWAVNINPFGAKMTQNPCMHQGYLGSLHKVCPFCAPDGLIVLKI